MSLLLQGLAELLDNCLMVHPLMVRAKLSFSVLGLVQAYFHLADCLNVGNQCSFYMLHLGKTEEQSEPQTD